MKDSTGDAGFDAPALRRRDWRRREPTDVRSEARVSRGEAVAAQLITMAEAAASGDRLGSKEDLRARCEVAVGTFNEALRIAQSRGVVWVRPGPGGGVFAAAQSPMVRLGNSVLALSGDRTSVAEAVRIRDALDVLLIEDALWRAAPADIAQMRDVLADMSRAVRHHDRTGFGYAHWSLHARIAAVSRHPMLRSMYINLLDLIESHTLAAPAASELSPGCLADRLARHTAVVDALDRRERDQALSLIAHHDSLPPSRRAAWGPPPRTYAPSAP